MPRAKHLCCVVNVFADRPLAARLLWQIRRHIPRARICLIHDSDRLKLRPTGEWSQRYLHAALATPGAETILKLDPDACIWRQPASFPQADWFGTISPSGTFIRGGACGFSRRAATRLVASGLLLRPSRHQYARYSIFKWPHEAEDKRPISCQDRIVGDAMRALGFAPTPWPEVHVLGNAMRSPAPGHFAITHPHPRI